MKEDVCPEMTMSCFVLCLISSIKEPVVFIETTRQRGSQNLKEDVFPKMAMNDYFVLCLFFFDFKAYGVQRDHPPAWKLKFKVEGG